MSSDKPTTSKAKPSRPDSDDEEGDDSTMEAIRKFFIQKFNISSSEETSATKVIDDLTLEGLIKHWNEKGFKNVITMVGAGISTSAGIPDFRSPNSGLYDNLEKFNLPYPSAIFEMDYFIDSPQPFFALAKELYPGTFMPTLTHYFIRLLHEKGLLLRHYSQNIDTLERIAGIPDEKLVEAHGTFFTNHCLDCRKMYTMEWMKEQIFADHVPTCGKCNGVVKPDIVFFGENLPERFYKLPETDFEKCDLLIVMGTSLEVQPFASLVDRPKPNCLRLVINRTKIGQEDNNRFSSFIGLAPKLKYDCDKNSRDVAYIGDCDDGVLALAEGIGWGDELKKLMNDEHARLAKETEVLSKTEKDLKNDAKRLDEQDAGATTSKSESKPTRATEPKL